MYVARHPIFDFKGFGLLVPGTSDPGAGDDAQRWFIGPRFQIKGDDLWFGYRIQTQVEEISDGCFDWFILKCIPLERG
jgi:hypothetical protein